MKSFLLVIASITCAACSLLRGTVSVPYNTPSTTHWRTANNQLVYKDQKFSLKGINWNGIESDCHVPHGMWINPLSVYTEILKTQDINAIRIPLSYEVMSDLTLQVKDDCVTAEPMYHGKNLTSQEFLGLFLDLLWKEGFFVVFDLHTIGGVITEYPWTDTVTEDMVIQAWANFAKVFALHPAVMGLEIKNEVHGTCTLDVFLSHCTKVIQTITASTNGLYQGLFFVGGVSNGNPTDTDAPWGGTMSTLSSSSLTGFQHPNALCTLGIYDRLVLCPHVYGESVRGSNADGESWSIFEERFGFITEEPNHWNASAIIPTEYGGYMEAGSSDLAYYERFADFMDKKNINAGGFWWTFPETSVDTGGLLVGNNWDYIDPAKAAFLRRFQPNPTLSWS